MYFQIGPYLEKAIKLAALKLSACSECSW